MNLRNLVIWGVIVVVLIGLYSMMTGGGRAAGVAEIPYSEMLSRVSSGEVKEATIGAGVVEVHRAEPEPEDGEAPAPDGPPPPLPPSE